jgi:hypothetical protein
VNARWCARHMHALTHIHKKKGVCLWRACEDSKPTGELQRSIRAHHKPRSDPRTCLSYTRSPAFQPLRTRLHAWWQNSMEQGCCMDPTKRLPKTLAKLQTMQQQTHRVHAFPLHGALSSGQQTSRTAGTERYANKFMQKQINSFKKLELHRELHSGAPCASLKKFFFLSMILSDPSASNLPTSPVWNHPSSAQHLFFRHMTPFAVHVVNYM